MDPNNVDAAGMPNESSQSSAVEQALAKEPMTPSSASAPMGMPVKKSGKGMLYGMIIFIILAIGGIGFGVWAMMDGNTQKANLEKQISELRTQNNKLLEQLAEGGDVDIDVDVDDGNTSVDPEDYIYVGEWGIKIEKPENWGDSVNYEGYNYDHNTQTSDVLEIKIHIGANLNVIQISPIDISCSEVNELCMRYNEKNYILEKYRLEDNTMYQDDDIPESLINYFLNPDNYSAI